MTIHHSRKWAAVALTVTGLLVTACSSSGSPAHTATPATPSLGSSANSPNATGPATPVVATSPTGSTTTAAHPVAGRTACALITEKDATARMGADPGPAHAASSHGATGCSYGSYAKQVLTVNVLPVRGSAAYDRVHTDPLLVSRTGFRITDVNGLGDRAFELSGPHTDALYFAKGNALIVVVLTAPTTPPKGAALALAKIAAGRL